MDAQVKEAKLRYKASMRQLMGNNWRQVSNRLGIYNPTTNPELIKLINNYKAKQL